MFENFPYSNFHDLNTDWIIKKIGDIDRAEQASAESASASAQSATAAAQSAEQAHASEVNAQESATASAQSATASANSATEADNYVASTRAQVNLLQSRVDNIIPSGTQTEGNTELLDIRVAENGRIYDSAGNAVRGQVRSLKNALTSIKHINLFNENTHSGIHSQTNGATYGTATENDGYIYTDLISLDNISHFYAYSNWTGQTTLYVTFFNDAREVVGSVNGYNIYVDTIPNNASYFCVTIDKTYLNTLMIFENLQTDYKSYDDLNMSLPSYAKIKYKRLDQAIYDGFQPYWTSPDADFTRRIYPYYSASNIYTTRAFSVTPNGKVSYRNDSTTSPSIIFCTGNGNLLSSEIVLAPKTVGTIDIPSNAIIAVVYGGTLDGTLDYESSICIVDGDTPPISVPKFNEIEIVGMEIDSDVLSGKSIVFDGDSITEGAGVTDVTTGIAPNNNKGWGYWIQQNHPKSKCYGFGKSGWTVGRRSGETDSLLNHIPQYPDNVDLFVLSGGYNDQARQMALGELVEVTDGANAYYNATFDEYTFYGALEYWFQQLRIKYPSAQIVYVLTPKRIYTTNPVFNNDTKGERVRDVLYSTGTERINLFWDTIKKICDKWSVKFIDLSDVSGIVGTGEITGTGLDVNSRYFQITNNVPDMTHPNTLFYKTFIVPQIESLIKSVII